MGQTSGSDIRMLLRGEVALAVMGREGSVVCSVKIGEEQ